MRSLATRLEKQEQVTRRRADEAYRRRLAAMTPKELFAEQRRLFQNAERFRQRFREFTDDEPWIAAMVSVLFPADGVDPLDLPEEELLRLLYQRMTEGVPSYA